MTQARLNRPFFRKPVVLVSSALLMVLVLVVLYVLARSGGEPWLVLEPEGGKLSGLRVDDSRIPAEVVQSLPQATEKQKLDRGAILVLAGKHRLDEALAVNPQLQFNQQDALYWSKLALPHWRLELAFLSRRLLLEAAERTQTTIATQGDLSYYAEKLEQVLARVIRQR